LSLLTGLHVDEVTNMLRAQRGYETYIRGVKGHEMFAVLDSLGFGCYPVILTHEELFKKQTVAAWLRAKCAMRTPGTKFLVNVTDHYIVVCGRKIYDNKHPDGVSIRQYPHRRQRVVKSWIVRKKTPKLGD